MSNTCKVCSTNFEGGTCGYCGFENIVVLGTENSTMLSQYAEAHKNRVIDSIKNVSVITYNYEWNASKSDVDLLGEEKIRICDGKDCFEKMILCSEKFKTNPAENEERELNLSYNLNGVEKHIQVSIKPKKSPEYWELGIMINPNLRLCVYVGYDGKYVEESNIDIDLHE